MLRGSGGRIVDSAEAAGSLTGVGDAVEHRGERLMTAMVLWGSPISGPTVLSCLAASLEIRIWVQVVCLKGNPRKHQ